MEPREKTADEVRTEFLEMVWTYIDQWNKETRVTATREKLEGLAFGMLVILDGGSGLPGFIVAPSPHLEDKEYHRENGDNWYPESPDNPHDIAGCLHELFHKAGRKRQNP